MYKVFKNHIAINFSFLKNKKIAIAVSAGIDSMVLLHLMQQLNFNVSVLHCNFNLRGSESNTETVFLNNYCTKNNIPIYIKYFETESESKISKTSIQITARNLRYNWFYEMINNEHFDYVLTAHNLNDQFETFIINLSRGTGIEGLCGIPEINNKIIRPLLVFTRADIENYANLNTIIWQEDSSNTSTKYLRNKVRHKIAPIFKELNPNFLESFSKTISNLNQVNQLKNSLSDNFIEINVKIDENGNHILNNKLLLETQNFKIYLFNWLKNYGFTAWNDINKLPFLENGKKIESKTHILFKNKDFIILAEKKTTEFETNYEIQNNQENVKVPIKLKFSTVKTISNPSKSCIFVDGSKIEFPLNIRKKQTADYFYPSGMKGKKKVSKFFKDEKLSEIEKEKTWILTTNTKIIWIVNYRADNRFLATNNTKKIIKIEFINA